jgi:hypothetical protein
MLKKQFTGKTVAQLKEELDSFEDQNMIVLINIDSDITSRPLGMLARVLIDGVHYAQLIGDRRQVLIEDFDE